MESEATPASGNQKSRAGYPSSIEPFPSLLSDWDPSKVAHSLKALYEATVAAAQNRIDWYDRKSNMYGRLARLLRKLAIALAGLGTLAPLLGHFIRPLVEKDIAEFATSILSAQLGYIALASAAILVALDNFFGYTSGWMRFRVTQADLVRRLSSFRYDWAACLATIETGSSLNADQKRDLISLHRDFVDGFEAAVESETHIWAERLQVSIASFERQHKLSSSGPEPPGDIEAIINNWPDLDPAEVTLTANGERLRTNKSGIATRRALPAGKYTLRLTAKTAEDGRSVERSRTVDITPGGITKVTI